MKDKIIPMRDKILVHNFKKGGRLVGSIYIRDDDGKDSGIRARWAQVFRVGEDIDYLKEGEWVLISHGRWSREISLKDENNEPFSFWVADPEALLMASEEDPMWETFSKFADSLPDPKHHEF